jgi:hypothetical protein
MIHTVVEDGKGGRCSTILNNKQTARMMPYETAERIAEANNKSDPEWDYIVWPVYLRAEHSTAIIRVHDEQGHCLGWL